MNFLKIILADELHENIKGIESQKTYMLFGANPRGERVGKCLGSRGVGDPGYD